MQINIKTSGENQAIVTQLTKKLTGGTKENVIARIALGYSLELIMPAYWSRKVQMEEIIKPFPRRFMHTIHKEKNTKTIFCLMDSIEIFILP